MSKSGQDTNRSIPFPKIAVIIPCFNHGEYIQQCINSVVEQDYPMKAMFISDEGSTDDSWDKIVSLFENSQIVADVPDTVIGQYKGTAILLSKNPNPNGPSGARNRLINMAWQSSDYFAMLDADDYYLPSKLIKSAQILAENDGFVGLVYTDAIIFHENKNLKIREYREPYSRLRLEQECIISNTPVISKGALEQSGLYDETMRTAEDWDLWLRITEKHVSVHIPEALHVYRVTGKNSSNVVPKEVWQENWKKIHKRINGTSH